jgi:hypothetical protein
MSIELEKLVHEAAGAGIIFMVWQGKINSIKQSKGQVSGELMDRIRRAKNELDGYFRTNFSAIRCFRCPKGEQCNDGTACLYPPA